MAKNNQPLQTLKVAFLGGRGCGKTTLLASYLGHMASSRWQKEHQYYLSTPDSGDSKRLNELFQGLCNGFFPEATIKRASAYRFQMHVEACDGIPLEIQWLDYPGEWWEREPADAKEKKQRDECLKRMVHSHVCFLVIDGAQFQRHGETYLRAHLAHMTNEIANLLRHSGNAKKKNNPLKDMVWVMALSKADTLESTLTAADFADFVNRYAGDQLDTLRQRLGEAGCPSFGMNYLLFSSVLGTGQRIVDINKTIGLDLIAPLALRTILEKELQNIEKSAVLKRVFAGSADRGALQALFNVLRQLLAKWPDRSTRDLGDLLFNKAETWVGGRAQDLQNEMDAQQQQGHSLKAAESILKMALSKPENRKYFYVPLLRVGINR
ncbi:MAG TPA: hypothetical protein PLW69_02335 [Agitococcus sp.]|jgi:hypothetical protein|nr:hypothetical protein [Moraxellaceae bacterium]MBK8326165.1 hypothetical protein [Moraxellaceae bacterium]MBL0231905.1 hypothetical protein [Moraxellaceae bacterium]HQV79783.1 hypothetical protein [Agitococcus sp.]